ncbi:MAG: hypothetical protein ACYC27_16655 [Armatimonadota bacterium]
MIAAREVRAVLNIGAALLNGKLRDPVDWAAVRATTLDPVPDLKRDSIFDTVNFQQYDLSCVISDRLSFYGPSLSFGWSDNKGNPGLSVNTGFGFLRLVWFQAAQCIAGVRDIYTCDGCGIVYIRDSSRRRPKNGCRNYCEKCAETARKRDWARRNKNKQPLVSEQLQIHRTLEG